MTCALPVPKYHPTDLVLRGQPREGRCGGGDCGGVALMHGFGVAGITLRKSMR